MEADNDKLLVNVSCLKVHHEVSHPFLQSPVEHPESCIRSRWGIGSETGEVPPSEKQTKESGSSSFGGKLQPDSKEWGVNQASRLCWTAGQCLHVFQSCAKTYGE